VREVLRFGFEEMQLQHIQATCEPANTASAHVLEKVGMSYEETLREYVIDKGAFHDLCMYAVLRHEWTRASSSP
jgi:[ribosomal protein S5]-alanine N-acetyltransferase